MRLLLVEDEPTLVRHLKRGLEEAAYAVDAATTCEEAADLAVANPYDVAVLDVMLPDGSGIELLHGWRQDGFTTPTLLLTARDTVEDKVAGLDAGADDYLTKPFAFEELLARLRSLLRRLPAEPVDTLVFADLSLDRNRQLVHRGERPVELTTKEYTLLEYLMLHPEQVLSRTQIAEHAWNESYEAHSNVIDVLMSRLRRKLESNGGERLIATVKGVGYALRAAADTEAS